MGCGLNFIALTVINFLRRKNHGFTFRLQGVKCITFTEFVALLGDYIAVTALFYDRHNIIMTLVSAVKGNLGVFIGMTEIKACAVFTIAHLVALVHSPLGSLEIGTRIVDEEDWANNWKAYFKPMQIGEKLLVCPSWEEVPEGSTGAVLRIDPGMAFGSGTHHTTRMCLELLEKLISPDMRVADLGCGSGILSIAASLMGARETYAIDIDPVAAKVAGENAALNGIDMDKYFIRTGDILTDAEFKKDIAGEKFDIVMANIVANIIIAFAPVVPQLMKDGGMFIASGIIDDRLDEVTEALRENGLKIIEVREGEDWRALLAEKA